jgi:hypothetical protein
VCGQVHVIWGAKSVDRTGCDAWNESDIGHIVWDDTFDASTPAAQVALLHACDALPARSELLVADDDSNQCVFAAFYAWQTRVSGNVTWPMEPADFRTRFTAFLFANQQWALYVSVKRDANNSFHLRHVVASFTIAIERHAPASTLRPLYEAWQLAVGDLNAAAPPEAARAHQASANWVIMAMQQLLMVYTVSVILALTGVGMVVLTIATFSPRLAVCCMLTVLNVVGTFTGLMVSAFDMELGMIGARAMTALT